jgi:predicted nuclease of restriction endonuclease-like (RecB) superfamily
MAKKKIEKPPRVPTPAATSPTGRTAPLPPGYEGCLRDLKERIRTAQLRASLSVNRELIALYWQIGQRIVTQQEQEGWGTAVIDRLAKDLQAAFPGVSGFSPRSIWRMRAFYVAYTTAVTNLGAPDPDLDGVNLPQPVAEIPWGHNALLIEKIKDPRERLWYARKTIEHGWSRSILDHHIDTGLYRRQGKALTNFDRTLPPPQSDLARQVLKDPYNFDFLTLADDAQERHLEQGLLEHIRHFLLELGVGFAFVGSQVPLSVGDDDFHIDLLFYHLKLRAFVVIDLKMTAFEPEYAGKMNFYLSVVDDQMRHPDDQPSIGIILCKTSKQAIAEYALRDIAKPVGVSSYVTRLVESLPNELQSSLPTVAELEAELQAIDDADESQPPRPPKRRP